MMRIKYTKLEIDENCEEIFLAIDLLDTTEKDFFTNLIHGEYNDDSRTVSINNVEYYINTIKFENVSTDVRFVKLSKL